MAIFNDVVYDSAVYDDGPSASLVAATDRVVFDGFSLSDGVSMICTDILDSGPTRELVGGKIPRGDGKYLTAAYFRERTITASGWCKAASAGALDTLLDTIRKNLRNREANLDITDAAGTVRRFVATCDSYEKMFEQRRGYDITICPWTATFKCEKPFGYSKNYSTQFQTIAVSPTVVGVNPGGDYKTFPAITLNFTAATSVTTVTILSNTTGEQISYTGTVAAGDIIVFDGEQKTVTKNGTAIDFTGTFPTLEPEDNSLTFTIDGTFSADTTINYKSVYL